MQVKFFLGYVRTKALEVEVGDSPQGGALLCRAMLCSVGRCSAP